MEQDPLLNLLQKYNVPGPRYTSYPTVPAWTEGVGAEDFSSSLKKLKANESLSLYFHLPFCEKLCHFCGCMKVITADHSRSRPYVELLLREIALVASMIPTEQKGPVGQLHFGGGTPNFLQAEEMALLMRGIRKQFPLTSDAEIAIEMHPRTSTSEFCAALSELGFNRISLGVQDFDPKVQSLINRHQTFERTAEMVEELRGLGFDSFNFDLIYGLPGQSLDTWQKTLEQVLQLKPNRLAVYSYAHVPWVSPVQRSFKDSDLPSPELKLRLFELAYRFFLKNNYRSIGMDHFALADDELSRALDQGSVHRNFMGYSTKADAHQIGMGVSAISYVGGNYFQNRKELTDYEKKISSPSLATFRGFLLKNDDAIRRDLITQIMCLGQVDFSKFGKKWNLECAQYFSQDLPRLEPLIQDGLIEWEGQRLHIRGKGFLFLRNIAMCFDAYLSDIQAQAKHPTFSKTV